MGHPRPKHRAAKDFSVNGSHFRTGDPITDPIALDAALRFGERFVTVETRRGRQAATADAVPAEAQPTTTPNTEEAQ